MSRQSLESLGRRASLEEDLYVPFGAFDFADHMGDANSVALINGDLIDTDCSDARYQRFIRIASARELEELDTYYDTTEEASGYSVTPDSGVHDLSQMDPEVRAKAEEEWKNELIKTEEEITTLRQVLSAKIRHMQELKRKLGITPWKEFCEDMEQGIRNIQETTAFQKTSQTLKSATEKTSEALGNIGASVTKKLEEVKKSTAFKSIEEKVGTAYTNVKTKVSGNTPEKSDGSFEAALGSSEGEIRAAEKISEDKTTS